VQKQLSKSMLQLSALNRVPREGSFSSLGHFAG
jgi:hypothetical protein